MTADHKLSEEELAGMRAATVRIQAGTAAVRNDPFVVFTGKLLAHETTLKADFAVETEMRQRWQELATKQREELATAKAERERIAIETQRDQVDEVCKVFADGKRRGWEACREAARVALSPRCGSHCGHDSCGALRKAQDRIAKLEPQATGAAPAKGGSPRYFLDQHSWHDRDGWFLVPEDRRADWEENKREAGSEPPGWARPVESPSKITFERWDGPIVEDAGR